MNTKYHQVILNDIQDPKYSRRKKQLFWMIGGLWIILLLVYALVFSPKMPNAFRIAFELHQEFLRTKNPTLSSVVLAYEYIFMFMFFCGLLLCFSVLTFFAYDFSQRNELIRKLLQSKNENE